MSSQVSFLVRAILFGRNTTTYEGDREHDSNLYPASRDKNCEELAFDAEDASVALLQRQWLVKVGTRADLTRVAVADACDDNEEDQVADEDEGLYDIDAGLSHSRQEARYNRQNCCQRVNYETGDKNGEELLTNVSCLVQVRIDCHLYGMVDVMLGGAEGHRAIIIGASLM